MISWRRCMGTGRGRCLHSFRHDDVGESVSMMHVMGQATVMYPNRDILNTLPFWIRAIRLAYQESFIAWPRSPKGGGLIVYQGAFGVREGSLFNASPFGFNNMV